MAAAIAALVIANSPLAVSYASILGAPLSLTFAGTGIDKPLLLWINDGLMAIFFFLVGLEVKREILTGQLASWRQASLPLFAAIGGMLVPALIYILINMDSPQNLSGWAIPAATDIAFALGVLIVLGSRVPVALKALLLAIAIIDDIGAIFIISVFYTTEINIVMLGFGVLSLLGMFVCNRLGIGRTFPYVILSVLLWFFILKSGVHATLAGVAAALAIPISVGEDRPLERMEHKLHPWVAFLIIPFFALANAGVSLSGFNSDTLLQPLPLGIILGLVVGKQIGIFGFALAAVKTGLASMPQGVNWVQFYALSCIAGIGFTMSLFIGNLAFESAQQLTQVKIGVLSGSLISALLGMGILRLATRPQGMER